MKVRPMSDEAAAQTRSSLINIWGLQMRHFGDALCVSTMGRVRPRSEHANHVWFYDFVIAS
jgi:hypothetical protein